LFLDVSEYGQSRQLAICPPGKQELVLAGKGSPVVALSVRLVVLFAVVLGLFASVGSGLVSAVGFSAGDVVRVNTDQLNMRSDAGLDGMVRYVLEQGTSLEIIQGPREDDGYVWYQARILGSGAYAGQKGWVAEDFITSEDGDAGSFDSALGVRVVDGPVNARSKGGTSNAIVGTLVTGQEVPVDGGVAKITTANGYDWISVRFGNGKLGWVATDFLTPLSYSPNLGSDDGWSTAVSITVKDGPVNMRDQPGTSAPILATLPTGATALVNPGSALTTSDGYTWVQIKRSSTPVYGWLAIDFLTPSADQPCTDGACYPAELNPFFGVDSVVVSDGPVNLRENPGTSSAIVLTLDEGDLLVVESVLGPDPYEASGYLWIEVRMGGSTGFVAIDFIRPAE
jgi:uncharacterized protein YraI